MGKYTKQDMVETVKKTGCTEVKAIEIVTKLMEAMESALLAGDKVLLSGIATIIPERLEEREKLMFGKFTKYEKQLKLTLKTSRALNDKFKGEPIVVDFKLVGDLFLHKK